MNPKDNDRQPNRVTRHSRESDVVEVTEFEVDATVRPMRESIRKFLEQRGVLRPTAAPEMPTLKTVKSPIHRAELLLRNVPMCDGKRRVADRSRKVGLGLADLPEDVKVSRSSLQQLALQIEDP
jgi:hypothetical protein